MQDEMKMVKQILLKNVSSFTPMMKNSKHLKSKLLLNSSVTRCSARGWISCVLELTG